jgi:hypothetical protein
MQLQKRGNRYRKSLVDMEKIMAKRDWREIDPLCRGGEVRILETPPERSPLEKLNQDINCLMKQSKQGKTLAEKIDIERQIKALRQEKRQLILAAL